MSELTKRAGVNWRQAGGEALLIFLGVGVALLGQAWWEYRGDRELEAHLLDGIRSDLGRDSSDIASAMAAAMGRVAGADFLLSELGDPDAGMLHPTPWEDDRPGVRLLEGEWLEASLERYGNDVPSTSQALYMVLANSSMQRFDLADATFSEATASGQLNVIQDIDLRRRIADYYFDGGRFGATTGSRVDAHWQHFKVVAAEAALPAAGGGEDSEILDALRANPRVVEELKNVRNYGMYQLSAHDAVLRSALETIRLLEQL